MTKDHLTNIVFGITFLNLSAVGACAITFDCAFITIVRLGALLCNLLMGVLLLFSRSSVSSSSPLHHPYWLGMVLCNIAGVKMVTKEHEIIVTCSLLFVFGMLLVIASLFSLGNSFTVTPMFTRIRTRFVYSYVRHPMYLGESIMFLSCILASGSLFAFLLYLLFVVFMVLRIREEETLLSKSAAYKQYCSKTSWRLLPYVW